MTTWKIEIEKELKRQGETWGDTTATTLKEEELDVVFESSYGSVEGKPFTMWTKNRVYFPVCYDGSEWVGSVSKNPDIKPTKHIGGPQICGY